MIDRLLKDFFAVLLFSLAVTSAAAQSSLPPDWDTEKIKGSALLPYPSASGYAYYNEEFWNGGIEFLDGVTIDHLKLRYSLYRDELIYYNTSISTQIIVDKISLKGFWMIDLQGIKHQFRQLYYTGYSPGNRFFEVLEEAEVSLVVYRKVILELCTPYSDSFGRLNNMSYQEAYGYYLYHPKKGFELLKPGRGSLLSKFSQADQGAIKKLLRKSRIKVDSEASLLEGWRLIQAKKFKTTCKFSN